MKSLLIFFILACCTLSETFISGRVVALSPHMDTVVLISGDTIPNHTTLVSQTQTVIKNDREIILLSPNTTLKIENNHQNSEILLISGQLTALSRESEWKIITQETVVSVFGESRVTRNRVGREKFDGETSLEVITGYSRAFNRENMQSETFSRGYSINLSSKSSYDRKIIKESEKLCEKIDSSQHEITGCVEKMVTSADTLSEIENANKTALLVHPFDVAINSRPQFTKDDLKLAIITNMEIERIFLASATEKIEFLNASNLSREGKAYYVLNGSIYNNVNSPSQLMCDLILFDGVTNSHHKKITVKIDKPEVTLENVPNSLVDTISNYILNVSKEIQ